MNTVTNKKILVTGGAGFIGSHLCERLLACGYAVVSVDNFNDFYDPEIKYDNIHAVRASRFSEKFMSYHEDIRNLGGVIRIFEAEKPDAVIHLAAMAGVRPSIENPYLYASTNILGTQNILDGCIEIGLRHLLFASSSSVYGNNEKVPFSESDPVDHPISPYAATKKAGELLCHANAHIYGMAVYCLRFFTVYGPRQRPDLAIHKFARLIMEDREIPFFGDGSTSRDYTYIDDIVDGVVAALERNFNEDRKKAFEIINLGGSETISLNQMVHVLEGALNRKARLKRLPKQPGDVERTCADITKAKELLGYAPSTPFRTGISRFASWIYSERMEAEGIPA